MCENLLWKEQHYNPFHWSWLHDTHKHSHYKINVTTHWARTKILCQSEKDHRSQPGYASNSMKSFNRHISQICEKVNKQFSVLKRFKNIITSNVMLRLYKAFILPHFQYCSHIWHFSGTRNCDKLESWTNVFYDFFFNDSYCLVLMNC